MKKIKVLYVTCNSFLWGDNRALINIIDGVTSRGIMPYVVIGSKGKLCDELDKRNINYKIVKNYFSNYPPLKTFTDYFFFFLRLFRTLSFNYLAEKKIESVVYNFKPNIIHTNVGPVYIGFNVARRLNIPHIWHIREYQDLDLKKTPLFSRKYFSNKIQKAPNNIIAITEDIYNHHKIKNNGMVITDGVLSKNEIRWNNNKKPYFLFVGRLSEGKGVLNLINAFIEFSKYNLETSLLIAGSGSPKYEKLLKLLVNKFNLNRRVVFLGFRKDVFDLMEKATAIVVPSDFEGFGFITVEAMFNGCLVIGNNTGGTKSILENENLGILYSGNNELVDAMKTVVSNGIESYYPMILKAQKRAIELYSKEKNAEAVYQFYEKTLNKV